ncbi:MAG: hypoxanthine phosphoribosyltransferase [bacterium]
MKIIPLITTEQIQRKVRMLGKQISTDYEGKNLVLVGILKGAFIFMSDLTRSISIPHTIDFMAVSSYGAGTNSSGVVRLLKDLDAPITDKHIVLVEDIIDSGLTLNYLLNLLKNKAPASLAVCALLDKTAKQSDKLLAKYVGFEISNHFVVGYGLDHNQYYRNLPYIAYLEKEI